MVALGDFSGRGPDRLTAFFVQSTKRDARVGDKKPFRADSPETWAARRAGRSFDGPTTTELYALSAVSTMTRVPDDKRRAVEPYLKFLRLLDDGVELDTRVAHVLDEFTAEDFESLSATLRDAGVRAGFSVPAIHPDTRESLSPVVSALAEDGHEILLHGYRHTSFMDVSYETAHEELSRASSTLDSVTGSTPTGFHVPYSRASEGTLRAAADLGVEWIVGSRADDGADDDLTVTQPIRPYDIQLLESDPEPAAAFERLSENADESSLLLCHPNVHLHHDGADAFADWLDARSFATPGDLACDRDDGPGLLLDCFPPFQVV